MSETLTDRSFIYGEIEDLSTDTRYKSRDLENRKIAITVTNLTVSLLETHSKRVSDVTPVPLQNQNLWVETTKPYRRGWNINYLGRHTKEVRENEIEDDFPVTWSF